MKKLFKVSLAVADEVPLLIIGQRNKSNGRNGCFI
jgi:hypothetical protein